MNRYLINFSYIGTFFKSCVKKSKDADLTSVAGTLEVALSKYLRLEDVSPVAISSRTDCGVHAIQNSAHFDCRFRGATCINHLITNINLFCVKNKVPLRVLSIRQVSNNFSACKFASQRTYLYRVAVPKYSDLPDVTSSVPISEIDRCHFLQCSNFNVEALQEVVSIFPGLHDFTSFCGNPSLQLARRTPIRLIHSFTVHPGKPLMSSLLDPTVDNFHFWDFIVEGRSFVYRQVRRMVSTAIEVALGRYTLADVQSLLDSPKHLSCPNVRVVPAHGLYLLKVIYGEKALAIDIKRPQFKEHKDFVHLLDQYKGIIRKVSLSDKTVRR